MKKLHSFVFCTLVVPVITLGSGALLAQESTKDSVSAENQATGQSYESTEGSDNKLQADTKESNMAGSKDESYMSVAPTAGMHASDMIGADVTNSSDEAIGSVSDLIIDEDGQVVAIVVGVGGFLGMGEKNVAVSWDQVTRSVKGDKQQLMIDQTREGLTSAPEYKVQK